MLGIISETRTCEVRWNNNQMIQYNIHVDKNIFALLYAPYNTVLSKLDTRLTQVSFVRLRPPSDSSVLDAFTRIRRRIQCVANFHQIFSNQRRILTDAGELHCTFYISAMHVCLLKIIGLGTYGGLIPKSTTFKPPPCLE